MTRLIAVMRLIDPAARISPRCFSVIEALPSGLLGAEGFYGAVAVVATTRRELWMW